MTLGDNKFSKRKVALAATFTLAFAACGPVIGCSGDTEVVEPAPDSGLPDTGLIDTGTPDTTPPIDSGTPDTAPEDTGPTDFAATPVFMPAPGTYMAATAVTITTATAGAAIHYTTDGTEPNTSSPKYSSPINVASGTMTIKAMAVHPMFKNSAVVTGTYVIMLKLGEPVQPTMTPKGGTYNNDQAVSITTPTAGATICYTVDGATPTCNATTGGCAGSTSTYSASSLVPVTTTGRVIKAIACVVSNQSTVATETYTLTVADPTWAPATGTIRNTPFGKAFASETTTGATVRYTTDGSIPNCTTIGIDAVTTGETITKNTTIKSIGCKTGYNPSGVVTTEYKVRAVAPTLDKATGTYDNDVAVGVTNAYGLGVATSPAGHTCFRTDGTAAACTSAGCATGSTKYTGTGAGAISITATGTKLSVVSCAADFEQSPEVTETYTLTVGGLTFNAPSGTALTDAAWTTGFVYVCTTTGPAGNVASTANAVQIFTTTDGTAPTCMATGGVTQAPGATGGDIPAVDATNPKNRPGTGAGSCVRVAKPTVGGTTVRAIACKVSYGNAALAAATYPSTATYSPPLYQVGGVTITGAASFNDDISLAIVPNTADTPADATICYSTDPLVAPSCNTTGATAGTCKTGTTYAAPFTVNVSGTRIRAVACKGAQEGTLQDKTFTFTVTPVEITPGVTSQPYGTPIGFELQAIGGVKTSSVTYRYNTGADSASTPVPTCSTGTSNTDGKAFNFTQTAVYVKVIACKLGFAPSAMDEQAFANSGMGQPIFAPMPTVGLPGAQGPAANGGTGDITNATKVKITTVSAGAPEALICWTLGATAPACTTAPNPVGCAAGAGTPATSGVEVDITANTAGLDPGAGSATLRNLRAVACGNVASGRQSPTADSTYRLRTSYATWSIPDWSNAVAYAAGALVRGPGNLVYKANAAIAAGGASPDTPTNCAATPAPAGCALWTVQASASVTVALDASDTPLGVTTGAKLCYTTDGTAVTFQDETASVAACTLPTGSTATCVTTTSFSVAMSASTTINYKGCKEGFGYTSGTNTYLFNAYSYGGVKGSNVNDFTSVETFSTSPAGQSFYLSWDATDILLGWKGTSVDNTSGNWFHAYLSANDTSTTNDGNPAWGGAVDSIPFANADFHVMWKADNSALRIERWNGAGWAEYCGSALTIPTCPVNVEVGGGAAGANSFVKMSFARSLIGYQIGGAADILRASAAIWSGTANTVGAPAAAFTKYVEVDLNSTEVPNLASHIKP